MAEDQYGYLLNSIKIPPKMLMTKLLTFIRNVSSMLYLMPSRSDHPSGVYKNRRGYEPKKQSDTSGKRAASAAKSQDGLQKPRTPKKVRVEKLCEGCKNAVRQKYVYQSHNTAEGGRGRGTFEFKGMLVPQCLCTANG